MISYINIQKLYTERAVDSTVEEGEYQYFFYEVDCDKCSVIVAVQSFGGGDPDLYVTFDETGLPDKAHYDFKSTSTTNEVLEITTKDPFFV